MLENTKILLYTPENEHFGIVPVEAMHMGSIVIACNSGGPLESVKHGATGYLITPVGDLWGEKIVDIICGSKQQQEKMVESGKARVRQMFTKEVFAD